MIEYDPAYDVGIQLIKEANSKLRKIAEEYEELLEHRYGDKYVPCINIEMSLHLRVDKPTLTEPYYLNHYSDDGTTHFISKFIDGVLVTEDFSN